MESPFKQIFAKATRKRFASLPALLVAPVVLATETKLVVHCTNSAGDIVLDTLKTELWSSPSTSLSKPPQKPPFKMPLRSWPNALFRSLQND